MDFTLSEDQSAIQGALDKLAEEFALVPAEFHKFALVNDKLENELEEGQYFDIGAIPELGALSAALAVERLARLPYTCETALSMIVRPMLDMELPRPFSVVENGRPGRFLPTAKTVIVIDGDNVGIAHPTPDQVEALPESLYAYPMGRFTVKPDVKPLSAEDGAKVKTWLRVALAAEMAGLLQAAIDTTVEHISVRKQFGRPLGTFQALRHRMAECAVLAGGVRWLARKAAWSGDAGDAAVAALYAQDSATRIIYDVHQMMGAMGMTLEMSLHLWTYRMKALISEQGGRAGQATVVAEHCFNAA
jgi:alkylation response protein AidB-like acyl-CoA dehydrogenase